MHHTKRQRSSSTSSELTRDRLFQPSADSNQREITEDIIKTVVTSIKTDCLRLIIKGQFFDSYTETLINHDFIKNFLEIFSLPPKNKTQLEKRHGKELYPFNVINIVKAISLMGIDKEMNIQQECQLIVEKLTPIQCNRDNFLWVFLGSEILSKLNFRHPFIETLYEKLESIMSKRDSSDSLRGEFDIINTFHILHQVATDKIVTKINENHEIQKTKLHGVLPLYAEAIGEEYFHEALFYVALRPGLKDNKTILTHLSSTFGDDEDSNTDLDNDTPGQNLKNKIIHILKGHVISDQEDEDSDEEQARYLQQPIISL